MILVGLYLLYEAKDIDAEKLMSALRGVEGVRDVHHVHVWALDEHEAALEAHIVVRDDADRPEAVAIRRRIRGVAADELGSDTRRSNSNLLRNATRKSSW